MLVIFFTNQVNIPELEYEIWMQDLNLDKLNVLAENTEKYKTFSVPIVKEVKNIDKNGNQSVVMISYKIKFIDSARFLASSLLNLLENLIEGIH